MENVLSSFYKPKAMNAVAALTALALIIYTPIQYMEGGLASGIGGVFTFMGIMLPILAVGNMVFQALFAHNYDIEQEKNNIQGGSNALLGTILLLGAAVMTVFSLAVVGGAGSLADIMSGFSYTGMVFFAGFGLKVLAEIGTAVTGAMDEAKTVPPQAGEHSYQQHRDPDLETRRALAEQAGLPVADRNNYNERLTVTAAAVDKTTEEVSALLTGRKNKR